MPLIRPISDLRNRALEISEICHTEEQPIFITRNGKNEVCKKWIAKSGQGQLSVIWLFV